ncbi:MAG: GtrA family protein [Acidobacteriia bacterium]|nr:GtrA family protein [Methyloceanibacter sp.]MCL6492444.1 GtrA family protein [Terriglobia bacterium]
MESHINRPDGGPLFTATLSAVTVLKPLSAEFIRFCLVGLGGFCVDTAVVYALRVPLGLIGAGIIAYFVAASFNWACNRHWTFRGRGRYPASQQWALFLLANGLGFVLNRGSYVALISAFALPRAYPVLAVAAGAAAGLATNFALSRQLVFR